MHYPFQYFVYIAVICMQYVVSSLLRLSEKKACVEAKRIILDVQGCRFDNSTFVRQLYILGRFNMPLNDELEQSMGLSMHHRWRKKKLTRLILKKQKTRCVAFLKLTLSYPETPNLSFDVQRMQFRLILLKILLKQFEYTFLKTPKLAKNSH